MIGEKIELILVDNISPYVRQMEDFIFTGEGYLIKDNGHFIGMIKGDFEDDECYYIDQIEILKDFRNKGYGKKSLYQLREQLSVSNFKGVSVPTATAFWSNMGAEFYEFCKSLPIQ